MSVLIKGMNMPHDCEVCPCLQYFPVGIFACGVTHTVIGLADKAKDCPLIEVPTPHSDLIDREELLNDASGVYTARPEEAQKIQHEINKVLFAIQDAPAVIEAEGE